LTFGPECGPARPGRPVLASRGAGFSGPGALTGGDAIQQKGARHQRTTQRPYCQWTSGGRTRSDYANASIHRKLRCTTRLMTLGRDAGARHDNRDNEFRRQHTSVPERRAARTRSSDWITSQTPARGYRCPTLAGASSASAASSLPVSPDEQRLSTPPVRQAAPPGGRLTSGRSSSVGQTSSLPSNATKLWTSPARRPCRACRSNQAPVPSHGTPTICSGHRPKHGGS